MGGTVVALLTHVCGFPLCFLRLTPIKNLAVNQCVYSVCATLRWTSVTLWVCSSDGLWIDQHSDPDKALTENEQTNEETS